MHCLASVEILAITHLTIIAPKLLPSILGLKVRNIIVTLEIFIYFELIKLCMNAHGYEDTIQGRFNRISY